MSGPKISVYSLTGRARTVVVGQIRCEQQSVACATQTMEILQGLLAYSGTFQQDMANIQLLIKRANVGADQLKKLQILQEKLKREASTLQKELLANKPSISAKYIISEEAYSEKQAELKLLQSIKSKAEALQKELEEITSQRKRNIATIQSSILSDMGLTPEVEGDLLPASMLQSMRESNALRIQESILEDISGVYSFDFEEAKTDTTFEGSKKAIQKKLADLLLGDKLPDSLRQEIHQALRTLQSITEMHYLTTFDSVTVGGLIRKVTAHIQELERQEAEYQELLARYRAICSMTEEKAQEFISSSESCHALSMEIERLEKALVKQHEQAYINDCVNEVMSEMGYDLIGERLVTKRSGKRFRNELFSFNDGTAVNVTYSSNGQISMELGGIAREDRLPSAEEIPILTHNMETFCGEFAEFERRLRARGIIVGERISFTPPTADYAAIINVTDYDINAGMQIAEIAVTEKRKRASEKKAMRRTD